MIIASMISHNCGPACILSLQCSAVLAVRGFAYGQEPLLLRCGSHVFLLVDPVRSWCTCFCRCLWGPTDCMATAAASSGFIFPFLVQKSAHSQRQRSWLHPAQHKVSSLYCPQRIVMLVEPHSSTCAPPRLSAGAVSAGCKHCTVGFLNCGYLVPSRRCCSTTQPC